MAMGQGYESLTEKEKQTLRLLLDGHDAKSMARHLQLSVHTINERLRDARRKLAVSSSKEAARMLRQVEHTASQSVGDRLLGDAERAGSSQQASQPDARSRSRRRDIWAIGGSAMLLLLAGMLVLAAPSQAPQVASPPRGAAIADSTASKAARDWLELVDGERWAESWAATGQSFRSRNSVAVWQAASEQARVPLGRMLSRTFVDEQDVPAGPAGVRMIRFRSDFANKLGVIEKLTLAREGDAWKVVGIYLE